MTHDQTTAIEAAAIQAANGLVFALPAPNRHHDVLRAMNELTIPRAVAFEGEQGFVTSEGCFVGRREARDIATIAGQLLPTAYDLDQLYSEDVW